MKTSEVYEKLYHYTNWDGLLGILKNQSLWATNYKYLNDYSEIVLFRDKLITLLIPIVREKFETHIARNPNALQEINNQGGINKLIKHDTEVVVDSLYKATGNNIFITSFCGQHEDPLIHLNGLLSQWRGYGEGGGFAIVIDSKELEKLLAIEARKFQYHAMHLSDIVYSNDDKRLMEELHKDLIIISNVASHLLSNNEPNIIKSAVHKCYQPFVGCISRYKHCGFREENEVRIVAMPTTKGKQIQREKLKKEIKYRQKNSQLVSYIELFETPNIKLPIDKIIVGPHNEQKDRATKLQAMPENSNIEITCSNIPYIC